MRQGEGIIGLEKLREALRRPSVARDLAIRLVGLIVAVFGVFAVLNYAATVQRDVLNLKAKVQETVRDVSQVLALPVWTYNEIDVRSIIKSYLLSEEVVGIRVVDDEGKVMAEAKDPGEQADLKKRSKIVYKGQEIGYVDVYFGTGALWRRALWNLLYNGVVLVVVLITVGASTHVLLKRYLGAPLLGMSNGIRRIAKGHYEEVLRPARQTDLNVIIKAVNRMAAEIKDREQTIRSNSQRDALLRTELGIARTIQEGMLLQDSRQLRDGLTYYYAPMQAVGGDWFSLFETADRKVVYAIMGDVSGHGIPQALITTAVLGALRSLEPLLKRSSEAFSPSALIDLIHQTTRGVLEHSGLSMTVVAMRVERETSQALVCNAGHTFPLILRRRAGHTDGRIETLTLHKHQQPELGAPGASKHEYFDWVAPLELGDVVCLYTDGLSDARDVTGRPFMRRFTRFLRHQCRMADVDELKRQIIAEFKEHSGGHRDDDVCLLLIDTKVAAAKQDDGQSHEVA